MTEWTASTLGAISLSIRNGVFARRPNDEGRGDRILRISAVKAGRVEFSDARFVEGITADQLSRFSVDPGDLLLTRYNGSRSLVGTSGLVTDHDGPVLHPDKLIRVVLDRGIADPRFVNYQLAAPPARRFLEPRIRTTAGQSGIAGGDVRAIPIALPSLAEQRRIVDILEDHLSRLDAANDYLEAAERRTRSLAQSVLDGLVWRSDVPTVQLASVLREPMRNGFSARASATGSVRVLTLTAVTRRTFTDEYTKMTDAAPERVRGLWLEPGDVFVQRANTPELVGSAALYDGEPGWAVFPDLLIRLRADPTLMTPQFLALALQTERCHRALRSRAKGLAGSMPKVDQGAIAALELPCPSLDEQQRIVDESDSHMASVRTLSDTALTAQRRSRALRRSALAAAFSGRLSGRPPGSERVEELTFA